VISSQALGSDIVHESQGCDFLKYVDHPYEICYPPFLGTTKEMVSRGPHVADMEYHEADELQRPHA
jgi:hypothetical protein